MTHYFFPDILSWDRTGIPQNVYCASHSFQNFHILFFFKPLNNCANHHWIAWVSFHWTVLIQENLIQQSRTFHLSLSQNSLILVPTGTDKICDFSFRRCIRNFPVKNTSQIPAWWKVINHLKKIKYCTGSLSSSNANRIFHLLLNIEVHTYSRNSIVTEIN